MSGRPPADLLRIGQVAARFGVSLATVRRWERTVSLRPIRRGPLGQRYYKPSDVEALIDPKPKGDDPNRPVG